MKKPSFFLALGIAFCSANFSYATDVDPLAELQIGKSFREKSAVVARDFAALSRKNLEALTSLLTAERSLERLMPSATDLARRADEEIILTHDSSLSNAVSILSSGQLGSIDELIRRKILPVTKKHEVFTSVQEDGEIGEQDVVYLALRPRHTTASFSFGAVRLIFSKQETLDDSYLTLTSFNSGSGMNDPGFAGPDRLKTLVDNYRPILFQGYATYKKLLVLSSANSLWLKEQSWLEKLPAPADLYRLATDPAGYKDSIVCKLLSGLNQLSSSSCDREDELFKKSPRIVNALIDHLSAAVFGSETDRVLASFVTFPRREGSHLFPMSIKVPHGFWEVKAPTALTLKHLQSIGYSKGKLNAEDVRVAKHLEDEIVKWASTNNKKYSRSESAESVLFSIK